MRVSGLMDFIFDKKNGVPAFVGSEAGGAFCGIFLK
jgi:hypothetical protein